MRVRRVIVGSVVVVAAFVGLAGCDGEQAATPVREAPGRESLYVALGGEDVFGGPGSLVTGWPRVLFRTALPITATFVNLAGPDDGAADVLRRQVEVARELRPDLVTITVVHDAEGGVDAAAVGADLQAVVERLRDGTKTRVLVGTLPPDAAAPDVVAALNAAVTQAANASGATIVDLSTVRSTDPAVRGSEIASVFAAAL